MRELISADVQKQKQKVQADIRRELRRIATEELVIPLPTDAVPSRGFLRVDTSGDLFIYAVHWKSPPGAGQPTWGSPKGREAQAAGIIRDAEAFLGRGATVIVAGGFNIQAPGQSSRVGLDPGEDCRPRGSRQGTCGGAKSDTPRTKPPVAAPSDRGFGFGNDLRL